MAIWSYPMFPLPMNDEQPAQPPIEVTNGICDLCGDLTDDPYDNTCDTCWESLPHNGN